MDIQAGDPEEVAASITKALADMGAIVIYEKALTSSDASGSGRVVVPKVESQISCLAGGLHGCMGLALLCLRHLQNIVPPFTRLHVLLPACPFLQAVAELYLPRLEAQTGITLTATDTLGHNYNLRFRCVVWLAWASMRGRRVWHSMAMGRWWFHALQRLFTTPFSQVPAPPPHRFWINNQSRMYLLEGAAELHTRYNMSVGDLMVFAQKPDKTLVFAGRPSTKVGGGR